MKLMIWRIIHFTMYVYVMRLGSWLCILWRCKWTVPKRRSWTWCRSKFWKEIQTPSLLFPKANATKQGAIFIGKTFALQHLMKMPAGIYSVSKNYKKKLESWQHVSFFRVFGRNESFKKVFKFDVPVSRPFKLLVSNDKTLLAVLSVDRVKNKEQINVYHSRKGIFLHKIILK